MPAQAPNPRYPRLDDLPPHMTVEQVADYLNVEKSWVYAECRKYVRTCGRRGIPCRHFGRCVRVPSDTLLEWLETR